MTKRPVPQAINAALGAAPGHTRRPAVPLILVLALAVIGWLLCQRVLGLQPSVFADEWYYSKMVRLTPMADAIVPSYLYIWLFSASNACGDGFLDCVRAGNLALFLAAAPLVFLVARRYAGDTLALGVAVLSTLAPVNSYTAYFMPESTYYFGFWALSYAALCGNSWRPGLHALACGAVLGLMSLVKVHAIFLLPALCLFMLDAGRQRGGAWFLRGLAMAAIAAAATFALRFGLGWVFAGKAGLSLFGPFYESTVVQSDRLALLAAAWTSLSGHLMTLAPMYGLPLAILVHALCARMLDRRGMAPAQDGSQAAGERKLLHLFTFLMLGSAAGLTIMYTAGIAGTEGQRLHLRYYSFALPLLAVVAAAAFAPGRTGDNKIGGAALPWLRWLLAILLCAVLAAALFKLQAFRINIVDGPDIAGMQLGSKRFRALALLQAVLLLWWAARPRTAPLTFLCLALPLAFLLSQQGIERYLAAQRAPTQTDLAAKATHARVPPGERGDIVVGGVDISLMMRAQFHIDHPDTPWKVLEFGQLTEAQMPANKKWLLLLGQYQAPDGVATVLQTPFWSLLRLPDPEPVVRHVNLALPPDPAVVSSVEGLSRLEPWGRWSDGKRVVIRFAQPLPRRAGVVLMARAHDVNANLPFRITVGGQTKEFRAGWHTADVGLRFDTDGAARTIEIEVPQPVSPEERGHPGDTRKLGIGLSEITITDGARNRP